MVSPVKESAQSTQGFQTSSPSLTKNLSLQGSPDWLPPISVLSCWGRVPPLPPPSLKGCSGSQPAAWWVTCLKPSVDSFPDSALRSPDRTGHTQDHCENQHAFPTLCSQPAVSTSSVAAESPDCRGEIFQRNVSVLSIYSIVDTTLYNIRTRVIDPVFLMSGRRVGRGWFKMVQGGRALCDSHSCV